MNPDERDQLLAKYLSGTLEAGEIARFEELLADDPTAAKRLAQLSMLEYLLIDASQQETSALHGVAEVGSERTSADPLIQESMSSFQTHPSESPADIEERAKRKLRSFLAEQEEQRRLELEQAQRSRRLSIDLIALGRILDRFTTFALRSIVGLAVAATLFLAIVLTVQFIKAQRIVATLDDSLHAKWNISLEGPELLRRRRMVLEQGFAQFTFKQGAEVLLQAPCEFELGSRNSMQLYHGVLTAKVPSSAVGFTVETPSTRVIDFGTEFGVSTGAQSEAQVHVFNGQIGLGTMAPGVPTFQTITKGIAATIAPGGKVVTDSLKNHENLFVRQLPDGDRCSIPGRRLDLADIVGGGNGFGSGVLNTTIDPLTGRWQDQPYAALDLNVAKPQGGIGRYVLVPQLAFVDGVFVPDSNEGPVLVSSAGHVFAECPDTVGQFVSGVCNGAKILLANGQSSQITVQGKNCGTPEFPAIFMHSNLGITFDLAAIRKALPTTRLLRFRSLCTMNKLVDLRGIGEAWILVDGQPRFQQDVHLGERYSVNIPLEQEDRFLTLISTDNGNAQADPDDWITFVEPVLDLLYIGRD